MRDGKAVFTQAVRLMTHCARDALEQASRTRRCGPDSFLIKPIRPDHLMPSAATPSACFHRPSERWRVRQLVGGDDPLSYRLHRKRDPLEPGWLLCLQPVQECWLALRSGKSTTAEIRIMLRPTRLSGFNQMAIVGVSSSDIFELRQPEAPPNVCASPADCAAFHNPLRIAKVVKKRTKLHTGDLALHG